jgi:hypothetical protein
MSELCESCAAPLTALEFKGPSDRYCKYCTDASGELLPKEYVHSGIASWLHSWHPGITEIEALKRAAHYMLAMPAWAER